MDDLEASTFERDLSPVARLLAAHDLPNASEVFLQTLSSAVNKEDVEKMKDAQEHMLQRFEKTNEMLLNFNSLSASRYNTTAREFKHHTQLLADMKKDLNNVFKRIRGLKTQLSTQFPESFTKAAQYHATTLSEEDEEEVEVDTTVAPTISHNPPILSARRPSHARNWERAAMAEARLSTVIATNPEVEPSEEAQADST